MVDFLLRLELILILLKENSDSYYGVLIIKFFFSSGYVCVQLLDFMLGAYGISIDVTFCAKE